MVALITRKTLKNKKLVGSLLAQGLMLKVQR